MDKPAVTYYCNKCGYFGPTSAHVGCNYFACTSLTQQWADQLEAENARLREELAAAHATIAQMRDLLDDCVNSLANYKLLQRRSNDPIGAEVTAKEISSIKSVLTLPTSLDALHEAQAKHEPAA